MLCQYTTWRCVEGVDVQLHSFLISAIDGISRHPNALVTLMRGGKGPSVPGWTGDCVHLSPHLHPPKKPVWTLSRRFNLTVQGIEVRLLCYAPGNLVTIPLIYPGSRIILKRFAKKLHVSVCSGFILIYSFACLPMCLHRAIVMFRAHSSHNCYGLRNICATRLRIRASIRFFKPPKRRQLCVSFIRWQHAAINLPYLPTKRPA